MKKKLATFLAAALTTASPIMTASPADAAEPWVIRAEYRAAKVDMAKARIHRIFDTRGVLVIPAGGMHPYESRHYPIRLDGRKRCFAIDYQRRGGVWRMVGKSRPFRGTPGAGCRY